tara:strand:+ start:93 stop:506 length:414 start_codon:yes stop_codon:yes gene_type:complete
LRTEGKLSAALGQGNLEAGTKKRAAPARLPVQFTTGSQSLLLSLGKFATPWGTLKHATVRAFFTPLFLAAFVRALDLSAIGAKSHRSSRILGKFATAGRVLKQAAIRTFLTPLRFAALVRALDLPAIIADGKHMARM